MPDPLPTHIGNAKARKATALATGGLALFMVGAAFASVPLYNLFCKVTGFDGTPVTRAAEAGETLSRAVTVLFDTNVAPGLGWTFVPEQRQISTRLGETQTVFFRVRNEGSAPSKGVATFNVQPGQAGAFFAKMKCFCFDEQTLGPGETMDFPVVFYVDPALAKDGSLDGLSSITLSYTYFSSRNGQPIASAGIRPPS